MYKGECSGRVVVGTGVVVGWGVVVGAWVVGGGVVCSWVEDRLGWVAPVVWGCWEIWALPQPHSNMASAAARKEIKRCFIEITMN